MPLAVEQSRCAFGEPPYSLPLNLSARSIVCPSPSKPSVMIVPVRVALNGEQFFSTGLDFQ